MADGVRTLPSRVGRRPLAADNGSVQASPTMRTALSRHLSGNVGLAEALHLTAVELVVC